MALTDFSEVLTPAFAKELITEGSKNSLLIDNAGTVEYVNGQSKLVAVTVGSALADFHDPDGVTEKSPSNDLDTVEITLHTMYKWYDFEDYQAMEGADYIKKLQDTIPNVFAKTLDLTIFGSAIIASFRGEGATGAPTGEYNDTDATTIAASLDAAENSIIDAGYEPNVLILDRRLRSKFRNFVMGGSSMNPRLVNVTDGFEIDGMTVYFRNISDAAGKPCGVLLDSSRLVVAVSNTIQSNLYTPENDSRQGAKNCASLRTVMRAGCAMTDTKAAYIFTLPNA